MDTDLDLAAARRRLKLTQGELAARWGLDIATIWRWENRGLPKRGAGRVLVDDLVAQAAREGVAA